MAGRFAPRPTRTTVRGGHVAVPSAGVPRQATAPGRQRTWVPDGPLDLGLVLGPLRRGPGDPTFRATPDGSVWRAGRTPLGPGTLRVFARGREVCGQAWGPGAEW
ncbi:DNA-3-methyladenine glycosylase 2 family protein, partial [Streptomyces carpinensis]